MNPKSSQPPTARFATSPVSARSLLPPRSALTILPVLFLLSAFYFLLFTAPSLRAAAPRPNIVVILVDDMGFSDIGCYGGEISTPNLDRLAAGGVRFTQFHNTARCCPTRAALLTGLYPHQAGVGHMTIVDFDDHAGKGDINTFTSYTARISGNDIHVHNITFRNSAGRVGQALALFVDGDRVLFDNCRFLGNQDTILAAGAGAHQYFLNAYIEGTTDFIFGPATAYFENCEIHSKGDGYITAPMRFAADEPAGFVFNDCRLTAANTEKGVFLGRPWRDYGRTVFLNTEMGAHIRPEGWNQALRLGLESLARREPWNPVPDRGHPGGCAARCLRCARPQSPFAGLRTARHRAVPLHLGPL